MLIIWKKKFTITASLSQFLQGFLGHSSTNKNAKCATARGQGRPKCRFKVSFSFLHQIKALSLFTAKSCDPPIKRYKAKCVFNFVL